MSLGHMLDPPRETGEELANNMQCDLLGWRRGVARQLSELEAGARPETLRRSRIEGRRPAVGTCCNNLHVISVARLVFAFSLQQPHLM